MAYAPTTNPPVAMSMGPLAEYNTTEAGTTYVGGKLWLYKSADVIATVQGAGYFSDGIQRGMQVGDLVYVIDETTPHGYLLTVTSQTPGTTPGTGSVTLNSSSALTIF